MDTPGSVDEQLELIENLNRRLEEMTRWREKFPAYKSDFDYLSARGASLGEEIQQLDRAKNSIHVNSAQRQFLRHYEDLWRRIQASPNVYLK